MKKKNYSIGRCNGHFLKILIIGVKSYDFKNRMSVWVENGSIYVLNINKNISMSINMASG